MSGPSSIPVRRACAGFTHHDALALVAGLGLLAAVQVASMVNTRSAGDRAVCLDNLRQLSRAWSLYAEDNRGAFAGNLDGGSSLSLTNATWAVGWLTLDTATRDNTNWMVLMQSQLGRYAGSPKIYKCPADNSLGPVPGGVRQPRVRSISMNGYVGQRSGPYTSGYRQFRTINEIPEVPPARLFVFIDEREDSLNDGAFFINMEGFDPSNPNAYVIVDYPGDRHNRSGTLSFADGHAETWRWKDPRTTPLHRSQLVLGVATPGNPDVARLQSVSSRRTAN
jgi:prepilin-type processing-associated H-X9-DG protein